MSSAPKGSVSTRVDDELPANVTFSSTGSPVAGARFVGAKPAGHLSPNAPAGNSE
jgi:hypothetical protein